MSHRVERAQDLIRKEVSRLLLYKVKDPTLSSVSVTAVKMTADLRRAQILYSVYDDAVDRAEIQTRLDKATGFFRREIARVVELRFVPEIVFEFDRALEYARHMDKVLTDLGRPTGEKDNGRPE
ncbi:MAG: 30S ribosome-binding factor RbfA [Thermodesulfobacteriota bacterium]